MYTTPAMKREQQVGVTGLCREVRQTKQEANWQIKGANTKWKQQNNCLLPLRAHADCVQKLFLLSAPTQI